MALIFFIYIFCCYKFSSCYSRAIYVKTNICIIVRPREMKVIMGWVN